MALTTCTCIWWIEPACRYEQDGFHPVLRAQEPDVLCRLGLSKYRGGRYYQSTRRLVLCSP